MLDRRAQPIAAAVILAALLLLALVGNCDSSPPLLPPLKTNAKINQNLRDGSCMTGRHYAQQLLTSHFRSAKVPWDAVQSYVLYNGEAYSSCCVTGVVDLRNAHGVEIRELWEVVVVTDKVGNHVIAILMKLSNQVVWQSFKEVEGLPVARSLRELIITEENIDAHVGYLASKRKAALKRLWAAKRGRVDRRTQGKDGVVFYTKSGRYAFRSSQARDAEVKRLEEESANPMFAFFARLKPDLNQIGRFATRLLVYRVDRVIDDENAIMSVRGKLKLSGGEPFRWRFWLHSSLAAEFRDGQESDQLPGVFSLTGRKDFQGLTLDLIEQYDLAPHLKRLNKQNEKQAAKKP